MTMKQKLEKWLAEKEVKRSSLAAKAEKSEDVKELRSINSEIEAINSEIAEIRSMIDALPKEPEEKQGDTEREARGAAAQGGFNPMGTYTMTPPQGTEERDQEDDAFGTMEYRQAFKNYVTSGTPIPEQFAPTAEMRADQLTVTTNVGAIIPTHIMNRVIEEATVEGKILKRITQTSYQGGVNIPISEIKPVATWITETAPSSTQKAQMEAKVSFSYHMLEARIAVSLMSSVVTLQVFENTIVKALKTAMIRALETAIVSGDGTGKPKGFLTETLPSGRVVEMADADISTVKAWALPEAAIPEAYEDKGIYLMNKKTWEKYLNAMTDANGQKIGLGTINAKGEKRLNGRLVETVEYIKSYDAAAVGEAFAVLIDLEEYFLNSNLNMSYKKYFDEDANKYIHKSLMIADGKMADANGLVICKKKA